MPFELHNVGQHIYVLPGMANTYIDDARKVAAATRLSHVALFFHGASHGVAHGIHIYPREAPIESHGHSQRISHGVIIFLLWLPSDNA